VVPDEILPSLVIVLDLDLDPEIFEVAVAPLDRTVQPVRRPDPFGVDAGADELRLDVGPGLFEALLVLIADPIRPILEGDRISFEFDLMHGLVRHFRLP
jgi:hypothetical protein